MTRGPTKSFFKTTTHGVSAYSAGWANAKPGAPPTEARRVIAGSKSDVQFNSCVYIDPANGEVYSVENDIGDVIVTFAPDATGDAEPIRKLKVTHRAIAMAIDEEDQEFFVSVQHPAQVAVYHIGWGLWISHKPSNHGTEGLVA